MSVINSAHISSNFPSPWVEGSIALHSPLFEIKQFALTSDTLNASA